MAGWLQAGGFAAGGTAFATGGWQLTALGGSVAGASGGAVAGLITGVQCDNNSVFRGN